MAVEVLYELQKLEPFELIGELVYETKLTGLIDNFPTRRSAMPYEKIELISLFYNIYGGTPEISSIEKFTIGATEDTIVFTYTGYETTIIAITVYLIIFISSSPYHNLR